MTQPLYLDLLAEAAGWRRERHQQMQPSAKPDDLERLRRQTRTQLGTDVPEEYLALLLHHDGLSWNGLMIYASQTTPIAGNPRYSIPGFVESNVAWREYPPHGNFLFFGESDIEIVRGCDEVQLTGNLRSRLEEHCRLSWVAWGYHDADGLPGTHRPDRRTCVHRANAHDCAQ